MATRDLTFPIGILIVSVALFVFGVKLFRDYRAERPSDAVASTVEGSDDTTFGTAAMIQGGYNLVVGMGGHGLTTESHTVLIGDGAEASRSSEVVIRFTDGTEFRHALPEGKIVDFRKSWPHIWPDDTTLSPKPTATPEYVVQTGDCTITKRPGVRVWELVWKGGRSETFIGDPTTDPWLWGSLTEAQRKAYLDSPATPAPR